VDTRPLHNNHACRLQVAGEVKVPLSEVRPDAGSERHQSCLSRLATRAEEAIQHHRINQCLETPQGAGGGVSRMPGTSLVSAEEARSLMNAL
jgi:hypothetical protein